MTLLDATTTLIDCAKTYGPEGDRVLQRAINRMELRLRLLQLRRAKAIRRCRRNAWRDCVNLTKGRCRHCRAEIDFGYFVRSARISGTGLIKSLDCPQCNAPLVRLIHGLYQEGD